VLNPGLISQAETPRDQRDRWAPLVRKTGFARACVDSRPGKFQGKKTGDGRWKGQIWVHRPASTTSSCTKAVRIPGGQFPAEAGIPSLFHLQALPYDLIVSRCAAMPRVTLEYQDGGPNFKNRHHLLAALPLHGLRKTLRNPKARSGPGMDQPLPRHQPAVQYSQPSSQQPDMAAL